MCQAIDFEVSLSVEEWWLLREAARSLTGSERVTAYSTLWRLFHLMSDDDKVEAQKRWALGHAVPMRAMEQYANVVCALKRD